MAVLFLLYGMKLKQKLSHLEPFFLSPGQTICVFGLSSDTSVIKVIITNHESFVNVSVMYYRKSMVYCQHVCRKLLCVLQYSLFLGGRR